MRGLEGQQPCALACHFDDVGVVQQTVQSRRWRAAGRRRVRVELWTGLRAGIGIRDPLLGVRSCKPVTVRYTAGDPRIFSLPPRFHRPLATSAATRVFRVAALALLWTLWWMLVATTVRSVLGVLQSTDSGIRSKPGERELR